MTADEKCIIILEALKKVVRIDKKKSTLLPSVSSAFWSDMGQVVLNGRECMTHVISKAQNFVLFKLLCSKASLWNEIAAKN